MAAKVAAELKETCPLYEFQCSNCGYQFERIMKFSDVHPNVCPECQQPTVEQVISAPAVQFKGSGWYVTDYARSGGRSSAAKSESATSSEKSTPPLSSSESSSAATKNAES